MAKINARPPSQQKLLYRQAWIKAYQNPGDGLMLRFRTKAGAYEARRHLYEAVREVKDNPTEYPMELVKAADEIQIVWAGDTTLHMRHRNSNDATRGLEEALGLSVESMMDPEALASQERMRRIAESAEVAGRVPAEPAESGKVSDQKILAGEHQENKFYGKRERF